WSKWALKEDFIVEQMREVSTVVNEYIFVRLKEDGLEITEETPIEEAMAMRQKYVEELQAADQRDYAAGLPTLMDAKGAINHTQLMGGFAEIRKYPDIKFGDERTVATKGYLGPIYGVLWRRWIGADGIAYDQIGTMLAKLGSDNPKLRYSRCNIVTAYQPSVLPDETIGAEENIRIGRQALAACHTFFQLFAEPLTLQERIDLHAAQIAAGTAVNTGPTETMEEHLDNQGVPRDQLSLKLYQRSADFPVGVPFNIAGYSLLLLMFCKQLNMKPAKFIHTFGDAHIYVDQVEGVKELLARVEFQDTVGGALPTVEIADGVPSMFEYKPEHFKLVGYSPIK
ncbi:MAG: thymidylate synthase, partial [Bradyrhizobium icense]